MTKLEEIRITDIEDFDSVDVVEVLVKAGERVEVNQPLVTLESEKAMMDFPSPYAGVVQKIKVSKGRKIHQNDALVTLEITAEELVPEQEFAPGTTPTAKAPTMQEESYQSPADARHSARSEPAYASPGVYQYARELGVVLDKVQGSGRRQRVTKKDVQHHVYAKLQQKTVKEKTQVKAAQAKLTNFSSLGETETVALTKVQKLTADSMQAAWQSIPHVTHFDQADVTLLEQRRRLLAKELKKKGIKLTPLAFIIKALVAALKRFPRFNASFDSASEQLILKRWFHIGIAVDTPEGLLVPVLRDIDKKNVTQIAAELMHISDLARSRRLALKYLTGASMTISSLGNIGGRAFTPIINPPEVAILGVSKMIVREETAATGARQQKSLPLSLSYDHRVINGAEAARFCAYLKTVLEDIWKLAF